MNTKSGNIMSRKDQKVLGYKLLPQLNLVKSEAHPCGQDVRYTKASVDRTSEQEKQKKSLWTFQLVNTWAQLFEGDTNPAKRKQYRCGITRAFVGGSKGSQHLAPS